MKTKLITKTEEGKTAHISNLSQNGADFVMIAIIQENEEGEFVGIEEGMKIPFDNLDQYLAEYKIKSKSIPAFKESCSTGGWLSGEEVLLKA